MNKKTAHTPGPWEVLETKDCLRIKATSGCVADTYYDNTGDEEANARLIAAAPDLLLSLKWAVELIEQAECDVPPEIRAFISKAEGK